MDKIYKKVNMLFLISNDESALDKSNKESAFEYKQDSFRTMRNIAL